MSAKEVSVMCSKPGTLNGDLLVGWGPGRLFLGFGGGPVVCEVWIAVLKTSERGMWGKVARVACASLAASLAPKDQ